MKHWAHVCPLSIRRFLCFHVHVSVGGRSRWPASRQDTLGKKKKRLINSYPFELSRGELDRNWMLLHSQAVTNVSDVPKNNNNSSSNCCHSVWARLTLRPRLFFIGGCSFFFFFLAQRGGRMTDNSKSTPKYLWAKLPRRLRWFKSLTLCSFPMT